MEAAILRDELHAYIDNLPDQSLSALKPLLLFLSKPSYVIETDLTDEELQIIEDGMMEYRNNPSSFIPLDSI